MPRRIDFAFVEPLPSSALNLTPPCLFADIAVYSGSAVVKTTSADGSSTVSAKLMKMIDLATGESQSVRLIKAGPSKRFIVEPAVPSTAVTVTDAKTRKDFMVVCYAATATDPNSGVTGTASLLLKGQIASAVIKGDTKSDVPKQLQGSSTLVSTSGIDSADSSVIASALVVSTPVLNLDSGLSKIANDAGHTTVFAALDDVKAALIAAGYTEQL